MPTPIEILLDPISLTLILIYAAMLTLERMFPARPLPKVKGWVSKTLLSFVLYFYLATYLPLLWDSYLLPYQLLDLSSLSPLSGLLVGLLAFNFVLYWWHRSLHRSDRLWRWFHQLHHSAERVDAFGAFYFSPFDMIAFTLVGSLALVLGIGISAEATTLYLYVSMFLVIFQHINIKTPKWVGYVIQRPESHSIHHLRGSHRDNYADLPIFDIMFGTFNNPIEFAKQAGFYDGASSQVGDLLLGKDVASNRKVETIEPVQVE